MCTDAVLEEGHWGFFMVLFGWVFWLVVVLGRGFFFLNISCNKSI